MTRDLRDPTALGEYLLSIRQINPKEQFHLLVESAYLRIPDYVSPTHPHDRYGDPRLIPCTLPN